MRTLKVTGILVFLGFLSAAMLAQDFQQPVLISSAGQSADVKLVNLLATREKIEATAIPGATSKDLVDIKTLLIVPGFSSKGLGAAGISQEEEMNRVIELVSAASKAGIPVVMVHIGGNARRKGQSDAFNEYVASHSRHMIVVAQGDEDGFFSDISRAGDIPLEVVENIAQTATPLGALFQ